MEEVNEDCQIFEACLYPFQVQAGMKEMPVISDYIGGKLFFHLASPWAIPMVF